MADDPSLGGYSLFICAADRVTQTVLRYTTPDAHRRRAAAAAAAALPLLAPRWAAAPITRRRLRCRQCLQLHRAHDTLSRRRSPAASIPPRPLRHRSSHRLRRGASRGLFSAALVSLPPNGNVSVGALVYRDTDGFYVHGDRRSLGAACCRLLHSPQVEEQAIQGQITAPQRPRTIA